MTKKWIVIVFALFVLAPLSRSLAQYTDTSRHHIAIFTPLYLDSAFDANGNYRYDKTFPKQSITGLEFWEGAQLAIDSLEQEGLRIDVHVYDTRGANRKFDSVLMSEEIKSMNCIIGHVSANEAAQLARVAASLNIPFINANYPNEVGVTNNPYYVILSPTLPTHCTGIYRFLQKNYSLSEIVVFRKKGMLEDKVRAYFADMEKATAVKLKLKYVMLPDNFTPEQLEVHLNRDKRNICVAGSLDPGFGQTLCQQLASLNATYPTTVIGMATWDPIDFEKPQYKGLEVVYSTPFYIAPTSKLASAVHEDFKTTYYARPSDMVFRGFESLYHFAHLSTLYGRNLSSSLSDKKYMLFGEYDIQPVIGKTTNSLDYFENKKLYFVKKIDGLVKMVY